MHKHGVSSFVAAVALLTFPPLAGSASLTVELPRSTALVSGPCTTSATTPCRDEELAPLASFAQVGASSAEASLPSGVIRIDARTQGIGPAEMQFDADGRLEFWLRNTSGNVILFAPGFLRFDVDATLQRSLGVGPILANETGLIARFGYTRVDNGIPTNESGSSSFSYYKVESNFAALETFVMTPSAVGGATLAVNTADAGTIDVGFASGAFTLLPNSYLDVKVDLDIVASATGIGSTSIVDASQTATLSLSLPAGVSLDTGGAPWVWATPVPEPSPLVLFLTAGGLLFVSRRYWGRDESRRQSTKVTARTVDA
jgi:hypothetical protein